MRLHRRFLRAFVLAQVAGLLFLGGACARPRAKTIVDGPPLEMPAPPPRDIEANEAEAPEPVPLPSEPAHNSVPRPRPAPPTREVPRAVDAPKPEAPKPLEPVIEPEPKAEDPPKPPTLQTSSAEAQGEVERNIRLTLARALSDLGRIDYRRLNRDARTQYDTAKSFIRDADVAVKGKNLVYAKSLADKAAALAVQLSGK